MTGSGYSHVSSTCTGSSPSTICTHQTSSTPHSTLCTVHRVYNTHCVMGGEGGGGVAGISQIFRRKIKVERRELARIPREPTHLLFKTLHKWTRSAGKINAWPKGVVFPVRGRWSRLVPAHSRPYAETTEHDKPWTINSTKKSRFTNVTGTNWSIID